MIGRPLSRRTVLKASGAVAGAAFLAACGKGNSGSGGVLNVWGGVPPESGPDDLIEAFQKEHPDIKVVYTRYFNDDQGKLKLDTSLQGGVPIDVFFTDPIWREYFDLALGMQTEGSSPPRKTIVSEKLQTFSHGPLLTGRVAMLPAQVFVLRYVSDLKEFPHDFKVRAFPNPVPVKGEEFWMLNSTMMTKGGRLPSILDPAKQSQAVADLLGPDRDKLYDVASFEKAIFGTPYKFPIDTVRRRGQLRRGLRGPRALGGGRTHALLRGHRRPRDHDGRPRTGAAAQPRHPRPDPSARAVLPGLAAGLAGVRGLGASVPGADRGVVGGRLQRRHLPVGTAEHAGRAPRGGGAGRRRSLPAVHHGDVAVADVDHHVPGRSASPPSPTPRAASPPGSRWRRRSRLWYRWPRPS